MKRKSNSTNNNSNNKKGEIFFPTCLFIVCNLEMNKWRERVRMKQERRKEIFTVISCNLNSTFRALYWLSLAFLKSFMVLKNIMKWWGNVRVYVWKFFSIYFLLLPLYPHYVLILFLFVHSHLTMLYIASFVAISLDCFISHITWALNFNFHLLYTI